MISGTRQFWWLAHSIKLLVCLVLIVIPIGPENDLPAVKIDDKELLQAKIMNFFVLSEFRWRGIGRRLQAEAIALAKSLSCYQLASFSFAKHKANYRLKLSMGYAIQLEFHQNGKAHGLYFIMPFQVDNNNLTYHHRIVSGYGAIEDLGYCRVA